jgi:serine/threonine-protein kinase ATR
MDQSEMESKIFDPIIKDTIGLVKDQISATGNSVSAVLLVGGFGQSKYLKERVKKAVSSSIQVMQPPNGWTAVVQGAAMFGLRCIDESYSKLHVTSRTARKHYGVLLSVQFDPSKHNSTKRCGRPGILIRADFILIKIQILV